jgi:hypothetical protein
MGKIQVRILLVLERLLRFFRYLTKEGKNNKIYKVYLGLETKEKENLRKERREK